MKDLERQEKLSEKQLSILNNEMARKRKNVGIAYILLIFLGYLGIHQFYIGKWKRGILYLVLIILGWFMGGIGFLGVAGSNSAEFGGIMILGSLMLFVLGIMLLIDLFTMPRQIRKIEDKAKEEIISQFENKNAATTVEE
ncbi:MAG TPA: TM2 domain-containing protein [Halanaerobiales bacterium]|nr:TM2 domain-containing protein [Halanaerobiales bacterium]